MLKNFSHYKIIYTDGPKTITKTGLTIVAKNEILTFCSLEYNSIFTIEAIQY